MTTLYEAALDYAAIGWAVFPLVPGEKRPATAHGFKDATDDEGVIDMWWGNQPKSNIGIACGASGLVVLDVDPRNGGMDSFHHLCEEYDVPRSLRVRTGGGGLHIYFRQPATEPVGKAVLASGLDLVAKGGYVVAPPSVHHSGSRYEWLAGPEDAGASLALCPEWLVDLANGEEDLGPGGFRLPAAEDLERIVAGERNNTLIRVAGAMRRWGMSDAAIEAGLQVHNRQACEPPLPSQEVKRIAQGVTRYPPEVDNDTDERDYRVHIEEPGL